MLWLGVGSVPPLSGTNRGFPTTAKQQANPSGLLHLHFTGCILAASPACDVEGSAP